MKLTRTLLAAAVTASLAGASFAQEATPDTWIDAGTTPKSRAQVQAELQQARADGSIKSGSTGYDFSGRSVSLKSRDQLRAEHAAARASGELAVLDREAHAFEAVSRTPAYALGASAQ